MERLTESRLDGSGMLKACENCDVGAEFDCLDCFAWEEAINRLAKLEDMLEKGIGMSSIDIYIKDKPDGEIHRIGDNQHDGYMWTVTEQCVIKIYRMETAAARTVIMIQKPDMNLCQAILEICWK